MKKILVIGILFYSLIAIGQNKIIVKIDSSTTNELIQNFQKVGNTVSILDAGGWRNINIANNAPSTGQVLKWDGTNWIADSDLTGGGGGGGGSQTLSTNGSAGHISISGGNSVTLNVNDADASPTNEIQTLSKTGNVITLNLGGGSFSIANNTPSSGQVLKWDGTQWEASTDLTGSGGGGQLYSSGTGINVNNTTFTISNTGDLSDVNEIQGISKSGNTVSLSLGGGSFNIASNTPSTGQVLKWNGSNWVADTDNTGSGGGGTTERIGVSQSVANGGRLMLYDLSGFATGTGTDIIINGANSASASTSTNGGNITFTIDHRNVLSKSGNTVSGSNGGGSFNIASNAPSAGQVLKWSGTNWIADSDLTGGGGGGQQYASGDGITVNNTTFVISATDISATNEVDVMRVSSSTTGGGRLQNATNGFNQASEIGLIISGATSSVSTGSNGSITWTLPDASPNNELQSISSNGNTYTLSQSGGSVSIAKSGAAITGSVLEWNGSDWIYGTDDIGTYTAGNGINISGNVITNTGDLSNTNELITAFSKPSGNIIRITEAGVNRDINIAETTPTTGQVMKWNGTQWTAQDDATASGGGGGQTYSGGTGISVNNTTFTITNTGDLSNTNELQTISKSGNQVSLTSGGSFNLSFNTPTSGQVLKWNGTEWIAQVDDAGITYTAGVGININGGNVISNTGDISNTNEIDRIGVSGSIANGGRIMGYTAGVSNGTGTSLIINAASASVSTSSDGGSITWTLPDDSNINEIQTLGRSGNNISISSSNSVVLAQSGTATIGSVLKWDGSQWTYGNDNAGSNYTAGSGISISGGVISNTGDLSSTNELMTTGVNAFKIANYTTSGFVYGNGAEIINGSGLTRSQVTSTDGGSITLGIGTGAVTPSMLSQTYLTSEVDGSTTNEIQTVSLNGNTVSLNLGGGSTTIAKSGSATTGKVLKWDGTEWTFGDDNNTSYAAGSGISISGGIIQSTGITNFGKSGNSVFVSDNAGTKSLNISTNTPSTGQVLKWSGAEWIAQVDDIGSTYTAGSGININSNVISAVDPSTSNELITSFAYSSNGGFVNHNVLNTISLTENSVVRAVQLPGNLYSVDGTITGNRYVNFANNSALNFALGTGSSEVSITGGTGILRLSTTAGALIGYTNGSRLQLGTVSASLFINNNDGEMSQNVQSEGTNIIYADDLGSDNLYQQGNNFITMGQNSDASVFSGASANLMSNTSSSFTKRRSNGVYSVSITILCNDGGVGHHIFKMGLYRSGSQLAVCQKHYYVDSNDDSGDMTFDFVTDSSSGSYTFRNLSGSSRDVNVKRILIQRIR